MRNEIFTAPNPNLALGTNQGANGWGWSSARHDRTSVASDDGASVTLKALADFERKIDQWSYLQYTNIDRATIGSMAEGEALTLSFELKCNSKSAVNIVGILRGNGFSYLTDAVAIGNVHDDEGWHRYSVRLKRNDNAEVTDQVIYFAQGSFFKEGDYYSFRNLKLEKGSWSPYVMGGRNSLCVIALRHIPQGRAAA